MLTADQIMMLLQQVEKVGPDIAKRQIINAANKGLITLEQAAALLAEINATFGE
jgi:hypothetical protein